MERKGPCIGVTTNKIVIVNDHPLVRHQLHAMVESGEDLNICGEAEDGHHALDVFKSAKPNLVMLDLTHRGSAGGLEPYQEDPPTVSQALGSDRLHA